MDRTIALIQKSHDGDEEARAQLVEENAGLVWCVVKRFYNRGVEAEDLFQIGNIGLLKAIDKFDLDYNVKFSTYAVPMISGEIKRFLRDDGMIKVSRSLKELAYKAYLCQEKLQEKLGREPVITEIARELAVSTEELTMAMEASGDIESLQKSIYQKDGQEIQLMDKLPSQERQEEQILDHMVLSNLLMSLEQKERQLIYLRYFANRTQTQVGEELGISQVQVSRMEKKILKQMRDKI
ncbi:MAG: RNA polymerase sporulation sigma factor, SigF/SigG family [Dorea sp.]|nr:RNA polymerase sporulation sigma factor, SigF/SigG family [Dorea sp.]